MRLKAFLRDRSLYIFVTLLVAAFSAFLLFMVDAQPFFVLFAPGLYVLGCAAVLFIEFMRKNSYYKKLHDSLDALDKKCLLSEVMDTPGFYEGQMLYDILKTTGKAMNDEIAIHSLSASEYREYIELWVHEVKTPIAGAMLIGENADNQALAGTLQRIDKYVEQALFYSRSSTVEKDFLIKETSLWQVVSATLRKNAKFIIDNNVSVDISAVTATVFTDGKWLDFILWQLLDNAIKYDSKSVTLRTYEKANSVSLYIRDDGIGIPQKDISRVFDKGFTGENGRSHGKSTGLGLYLCKKLCVKLGLGLSLQSEPGKGVTVEIAFPKSSMYHSHS